MNSSRETGILIRKVFGLLQAHPEGLTIKALLEEINGSTQSSEVGETNNAEAVMRRGCIAPLNAGWLLCRRGHHLSITAQGRLAYARYQEPAKFMSEAGKLSARGWLSLRFPKSYYFAGKIKDQLSAEFRAAQRIGVSRLLKSTLKSPSSWERILPLQEPRRVNMPRWNGDSLLTYLNLHCMSYAEGGHAVYLSPEAFKGSEFRDLARDYPPNAGLKIVKNPGGIDASGYVHDTAKGDSRIHLRLIHNHRHLTLVANLLFSKGVGPRLYDLVELQGGDQLWTAYVIEHVGGAVPSNSECEAGIRKLRDLEEQELMKVILPDGFDDEEFECPSCCNNALTSQNGEFRYIDFQNFILIKYESFLKSVAVEATSASHFGDNCFLRGGQYLYQTVPGVNLPGKRRIEERVKVLNSLMAAAKVSIKDRLVLDIGCNIGMMMAQYLKLGARWCHGWDRSYITPHTEKLLLALGCTRFSTSCGDITKSQSLERDLLDFLKPHLDGCVISYLAVRGHLGWLDTLAKIPWKFLIYEGHEGETKEEFEQHVQQFRSLTNFKVSEATSYADGDCDERTMAILLRT
jgi:hypothetical protein